MESIYYVAAWACHRRCDHCYEDRFRPYVRGEEVFMLLSLRDDPNRIAVQGKGGWITPDGGQGNRTQGIGVQFTLDETGAAAKAAIERILGEHLASTRPTHTM